MANTSYTLSINIEEAESAARNMSSTNENLKSKLEEISGVINNMQNVWDADTARGTTERFNQLKGQFNAYYERVKKFADFVLNDVSTAYQTGEKTITVNTNNIQNERAKAES